MKADGEWINNLQEITDHSAIFHDFLGDRILALHNSTPIIAADFQITELTLTPNDESKSTYEQTFKTLIQAIDNGRFEKVILSRTKVLPTEKSALEIFDKLNETYSNTFNYVISNPSIGTWIGASPEHLLEINDNTLSTMSLAGTKTSHDEWTEKEFREQALVTTTIEKVLKAGGCSQLKLEGPSNLQAGKIEHLHTKITAIINQTNDWKKIATLLHPTPAVCGLPTEEARQFIPTLEHHQRKFYTGFLGLIAAQNIQLFVNLRCMELSKKQARLYIGGGIIAGSICEDEWRETERKSETLGALL